MVVLYQHQIDFNSQLSSNWHILPNTVQLKSIYQIKNTGNNKTFFNFFLNQSNFKDIISVFLSCCTHAMCIYSTLQEDKNY